MKLIKKWFKPEPIVIEVPVEPDPQAELRAKLFDIKDVSEELAEEYLALDRRIREDPTTSAEEMLRYFSPELVLSDYQAECLEAAEEKRTSDFQRKFDKYFAAHGEKIPFERGEGLHTEYTFQDGERLLSQGGLYRPRQLRDNDADLEKTHNLLKTLGVQSTLPSAVAVKVKDRDKGDRRVYFDAKRKMKDERAS